MKDDLGIARIVLVPAVVGASGVLASAIKQCQSLDTGLSRTKAGDTGAPGAATADFVVIQTHLP
ncbi:MAG: hypothetical protein WCC90_07075 [Methylocella sp.]